MSARYAYIVSVLLSAFMLPPFFPAALALLGAFLEPLLPFAVGLLLDTLYYAPHAAAFPYASILGGLVSLAALFVRGRVSPGTMH